MDGTISKNWGVGVRDWGRKTWHIAGYRVEL